MKNDAANEKMLKPEQFPSRLRVYSSQEELEEARLREAVFASDAEKFRKFCRMLRIGKVLASAKITHKQ